MSAPQPLEIIKPPSLVGGTAQSGTALVESNDFSRKGCSSFLRYVLGSVVVVDILMYRSDEDTYNQHLALMDNVV